MCGIFGFAGSPDRQLLGRMGAAIVHRGPDDAGAFETPSVSLGHRRLSIIDREGGHQPVANEDETVWLVYNGEVYNYRELRAELEAAGHVFRSHCDSEVIVHAYEEWGPACAARFNGMWAFAVADLRGAGEDGRGGKLVLNRDHFGIKPLYYARSPQSGRLLFASEIKALLQDPELVAEPDEQMVFEYLQHGFHDHRAETFFRGVYHVPAATWIELPLDGAAGAPAGAGGEAAPAPGMLAAPLESTPYWTPVLTRDGGDDPADFRRRFRESVERRLVSEVPVGSCLSGGLDSTTIVSFMSELLQEDVPDAVSLRGQLKTFSAVFDGDPIDEREYIETAVESTGADTTYTNPTSHEFIGELRDFVWHQEEPIVSTGPYAQWCVMRSAREQVTVLLDGQGGDELIAGYVPYQLVYLRQLRKQGDYDLLRREATASRDVLMPLAKRRLKQRRKRLPTRTPPAPGVPRPDHRPRVRALPVGPQGAPPPGPAHVQPAVPAALRGPQLHGVQHREPGAVPRPGVRGPHPEPAGGRHRASRLEPLDPARGAQGHAAGEDPPAPLEGRVHDAGDALDQGAPGGVHEPVPVAGVPGAALLGRRRRGGGVPRLLQGPGGGEHVLLARRQRRALAARVRRPERGHRGRRRRGGAGRARPRRPGAPRQHRRGGRRAGAGAAGGGGRAVPLRPPRPSASWPGTRRTRRSTCSPSPAAPSSPACRCRTDLVGRGDDLDDLMRRQIVAHVKPGDLVVMAEKPIAASQGRSYALDEIHPTKLAKLLSKAVTKTPHGIGLGIPETMQLAIDEAGAPRIVAAAAVSAAGKVVGKRGLFYKVAGADVEAIDGPTWNTLPPHNTHAKLGPADPDGVAAHLADVLSDAVGGRVEFVVIDANDLTAAVLGASPGADRALAKRLMRDNPLGQGHEQTPVCVLRALGPLTAAVQQG